MSTQPLSNHPASRGESPEDVERRNALYFLSLVSNPAGVAYMEACIDRGVSVYNALEGFTKGIPIEYLLAMEEGND